MDVTERETSHQDTDDVVDEKETTSKELCDTDHRSPAIKNKPDIKELVNRACKEMEISVEDKMKLEGLNINITWEVPYIHTIERKKRLDLKTLTHIKQYLAERGLKLLVKERYTPKEDTTIKKNWEEFSQEYGFNSPSLFFRSHHVDSCFHKTEKYKFKLFLARNIPTRLLQSVQNRFEELYGTVKQGRFSPDEDLILLTLMKYDLTGCNIPRLKVICKILGRAQMSVTMRLKMLLEGKVKNPEVVYQRRISYEVNSQRRDLIKILLKTAMQKLNIKNYKDLQFASLPDAVFDEVGYKIRMPAVKVKRYWHDPLYPQLFAKGTLSRNRIRARLIRLLSKSPYNIMVWEDVPWDEVSQQLGNIGPFFAYRRVFEMARRYVPKTMRTKFTKCIRHLKQNYLQGIIMDRIKDVIMSKIRYSFETDEITVIEERRRKKNTV